MDTILLKKLLYWGVAGILCLLAFVFNIKDLNNFEPFKQVCYTCTFNVKVTKIKKRRDYYITGENLKGKSIEFEVYDVWNLKELQVGDSIIKQNGEWKIKIVKRDTTLFIEPEFPVQWYRTIFSKYTVYTKLGMSTHVLQQKS